ncbi:IS630 family transposase [Motiliproteus sp. MSK22-1]|uniref:IS630 family transposase n=1 Tax=Motiliproteus sp. MSK22-1 TaxID=1897630 RepID=UPI000975B45A|nr:hypothetical protein BGP75_10230 [Motiliproteus sp. MSK22-1]
MKKTDASKLSTEVQQRNCDLTVCLFLQGQTRKQIAEIVGVHYAVACRWIKVWKQGGEETIKLEQCGRRLVEHGDYLKRWGYTPQKPAKRAYERKPKAVKEWLNNTYPKLKRRASEEGSEIYWGDETGGRNDCQHRRGYAPKGKTAIVEINDKRFSMNVISAVNNRGVVRFMMYRENMTAKVLLRFMKRLIKDAGKKVFLVLDNLRVHHAKLARHVEKIEVFYLPAYSPDLNPDEYLNADLKAEIRGAAPARNQADLAGKVQSHMRMLQKRPERVAKYFKHPSIHCATLMYLTIGLIVPRLYQSV